MWFDKFIKWQRGVELDSRQKLSLYYEYTDIGQIFKLVNDVQAEIETNEFRERIDSAYSSYNIKKGIQERIELESGSNLKSTWRLVIESYLIENRELTRLIIQDSDIKESLINAFLSHPSFYYGNLFNPSYFVWDNNRKYESYKFKGGLEYEDYGSSRKRIIVTNRIRSARLFGSFLWQGAFRYWFNRVGFNEFDVDKLLSLQYSVLRLLHENPIVEVNISNYKNYWSKKSDEKLEEFRAIISSTYSNDKSSVKDGKSTLTGNNEVLLDSNGKFYLAGALAWIVIKNVAPETIVEYFNNGTRKASYDDYDVTSINELFMHLVGDEHLVLLSRYSMSIDKEDSYFKSQFVEKISLIVGEIFFFGYFENINSFSWIRMNQGEILEAYEIIDGRISNIRYVSKEAAITSLTYANSGDPQYLGEFKYLREASLKWCGLDPIDLHSLLESNPQGWIITVPDEYS